MTPHPSQMIVYTVSALIFLVVLSFRMRRMMQSRPFKLQFIWVLPAIFLAMTIITLSFAQPRGLEWVWAAAMLAAGTGLGWLRGRSISMSVDPVSHQVQAKGSPTAMIFIVVLLLVRYGLRYLMQTEATVIGVRLPMVDVLFLVLALGLFVARAAEMGLRGRKLLGEARASALATV